MCPPHTPTHTSAVPEMRVRFTSPHPKDFPDDLLHLMRERPNLCNSVHLPAQSGSTEVLKRMRRGYTREAYLELLHRVREVSTERYTLLCSHAHTWHLHLQMIPGVGISTDIITGFCGETAADHEDTVSLMREASYEQVVQRPSVCCSGCFSDSHLLPRHRTRHSCLPTP